MKKKISITIEEDILKFLDKKVREKVFRNKSHGFESAVHELMKKEKG